MYLRETKRTNVDGTVRRYVALAHNYRDPDTGRSKPEILFSFGRVEQVDRNGLERLVASIAKFLDDDTLLAAVADDTGPAGGFEPVDARSLGGAWVLDQLWDRLGIAKVIRKVAGGRKLDATATERILFALVASRALAPSSKLEATRWIREDVYIPGLAEVDSESCYRTMDFFLDVLPELQETVFFTVADLLQLEVDMIFFDTTSTYFELEQPDPDDDNGEAGFRTHGKSKDHRDDLPQVVIGMAVTRGGMPVRLWVWPGNTQDQTVLDEVKSDLAGWQLNRTVWVVDAGFASADNRRILSRGGSSFITAEKLRGDEHAVVEARGRPGRYHTVNDQLKVKEVIVGDGAGAERFVICRNDEVARKDAAVRGQLVTLLENRIAGSDDLTADKRAELVGTLKSKPGLKRFLRTTKSGLLRIDRTAIRTQAHFDGKFLLRTWDRTLSPADIALGYKSLMDVEDCWRDMKQLDLRPVFHRREDRIISHVQLCWLALLLIRTIEARVGDTWRNIAAELDRIKLVTIDTGHGTVSQRTRLTTKQRHILEALDLPEPPRYFEFTPLDD